LDDYSNQSFLRLQTRRYKLGLQFWFLSLEKKGYLFIQFVPKTKGEQIIET
ncbi:unnamed protein product, partial [Brassica oleracea var. botrytis]